MTMSIEEISDRIAINDLLIAYCSALDNKDFDALDDVFTPDAFIDYSQFDAAKGEFPVIKDYLQRSLEPFPSHQHMVSNIRVWLDGDKARAKTICHHPIVVSTDKDTGSHTMFYGLWYVDELIRTKQGWRIAKRVIEKAYSHNVPETFNPIQQ